MSADAPTDAAATEGAADDPVSTAGLLSDGADRLGSDPRALVPFLLAGVVLATANRLRRRDPVPVVTPERLQDGHLAVAYAVFPTGVAGYDTPVGALFGLRWPYLAWTLGVGAAAVAATALSGALTIRRLDSRPVRDPDSDVGADAAAGSRADLARYVAVAAALAGLGSLGRVEFDGPPVLFGLLALSLVLAAFVRLFAVPVLLVRGRGVAAAVRESARRARGRGWTVFGLVVAVGFANFLLGSVPVAGPLLSTALVAPLHAAAVVAFVRRTDRSGDLDRPAPDSIPA